MRNKRKFNYRRKYTEHHKICSSRWWVWSDENLVDLKKSVHMGLHNVFSNALPHEQASMLFELNESVLTPEVVKLVEEVKVKAMELLKQNNFYKKSCYKHLKT